MPSPRNRSNVPQILVILVQDGHDLLGFGGLGKGGKPAKIAKQYRDLSTVACQERFRCLRGCNHPGYLRRQESLQPADPLDFSQLLRHALLEQPIPTRQLLGLRLELLGLRLHRVVKLLDPQQ